MCNEQNYIFCNRFFLTLSINSQQRDQPYDGTIQKILSNYPETNDYEFIGAAIFTEFVYYGGPLTYIYGYLDFTSQPSSEIQHHLDRIESSSRQIYHNDVAITICNTPGCPFEFTPYCTNGSHSLVPAWASRADIETTGIYKIRREETLPSGSVDITYYTVTGGVSESKYLYNGQETEPF